MFLLLLNWDIWTPQYILCTLKIIMISSFEQQWWIYILFIVSGSIKLLHLHVHACKILFSFEIVSHRNPVYRGRKVYISNETHLYSSLSHIWYVQSIEVNCFFFITSGNNPIVVNNTQCRGLYSFVNFSASAVCYTNPLITGRYVGISNVRKQALQLCEVEIYLRGICHCT